MSHKKFSTNKKGKCTHDTVIVKCNRKNYAETECLICGKKFRLEKSEFWVFWERKKKNPIKVILI